VIAPAPTCQLVEPQLALDPIPVVVTSTDELMELEGVTITEDDPLRVALVIVRVPTGVGVGVGVFVGVGVGVFVGVGVGVFVGVGVGVLVSVGVGVFVGVGVGVFVGVGVGVFVGDETIIPPVRVNVALALRLQASSL